MKLHRRNGFAPQLLNLCLFGLLLGLVVFSAGCVISPRRLPGNVVPGSTATPTPTPGATPTPTPVSTPTPSPTPAGPQGKLYVTDEGGNAIVRFDNAFTATGNIVPSATITGANTHLNRPEYVFLDVAADRLFVANLGASSILVFDAVSTKSGNIAPSREIVGPTTGLVQPVDLAYDKGRDLLYVADGPDIAVFSSASTANGDLAPGRTITVSFSVSAIFLDSGDRLYAADFTGNAIDVYDAASTLTGTVTANRTLTGANTALSLPSGIVVDFSGKLIVSNATSNEVTIYNGATTITGNQTPNATIVGANTKLLAPAQMTLNTAAVAGELVVANPLSGDIPVFSGYATANGNITPARLISGSNTTLVPSGGVPTARGVAFDSTR